MVTETRTLRELNTSACPITFLSAPVSRQSTLSKNSCAFGLIGGPWTIVVQAGAYTSNISQADADSKANTYANSLDTQANANANGSCSSSDIFLSLTVNIVNNPNFGDMGVGLEVVAQIKNQDGLFTSVNQIIYVDYYLNGSGVSSVGGYADLQLAIQPGSFTATTFVGYASSDGSDIQAIIHGYSQASASGRNIVFVNP